MKTSLKNKNENMKIDLIFGLADYHQMEDMPCRIPHWTGHKV